MESPKFYHPNTTYSSSQFTSDKHLHHSLDSKTTNADHFVVEDLLDFSNDNNNNNDLDGTTAQFETLNANSTDSSTITSTLLLDNSCNSSSFTAGDNIPDGHFSGDLCVPYDELAELEWLSNFVEEDSFSSEDLQKLHLISGSDTRPIEPSVTRPYQPEPDGQLLCYDSSNNASFFNPETVSVPAKARSKRSRAISCNWASRLLMLAPTTSSNKSDLSVTVARHQNSNTSTAAGKKTSLVANNNDMGEVGSNGDGRKCLHCATDKTPQWRTGPMGPKTLCNACGVRYKSGRLVPEYRPASSPTFVLTKHSNSHRKVLELRRQKDMVKAHQHQQQQFLTHHHQSMMYEVSSGEDCLIHRQHGGPDYRRLI